MGAKKSPFQATEKEIQKACLDWLALNSIFAWRNNTGAYRVMAGGREHFVRYGYKGSSDIIGVLPDGKFLAVEVKGKYGKLTIDQEEFLQRINDNGGVGFVVFHINDLINKLSQHGYTNKTRTY